MGNNVVGREDQEERGGGVRENVSMNWKTKYVMLNYN